MDQKRSDYEVDERAANAQTILNDPIVVEAVDNLRKKYQVDLLSARIGSADAIAAHAGVQMVEGFLNELKAMITDKAMRDHHKKRTTNYER